MSTFETDLFLYFSNLKNQMRAMPLNLGGIAVAASGGYGAPPGGFIGFIPQTRVGYDTLESEISGFISPNPYSTSGILISASLLDNLNHIRFRLGLVEGLAFNETTISVKDTGILIASGVSVLNFTGLVDVESTAGGEVTITVTGITLDEKVKVSSNDTTADYLENKISEGTYVTLSTQNEGANETLQISAADEKTKISSNDTTENYLENKVVEGDNVTITVQNEGANETLRISATGSGFNTDEKVRISVTDSDASYLDDAIVTSGDVFTSIQNPTGDEALIITTSGRMRVSADDTTYNYLENKLTEGTNITITVQNPGGNENVQIASADEKTKVSSNDTTANYLENKLVEGNNITITVQNEGANETLLITASGGGTGSAINVKDEGVVVASAINFLDFRGPTVTAEASDTGTIVTISGLSAPFIGAKTYRTSDWQMANNTSWQNLDYEASEYESDDTMWSSGSSIYVREAGYYSVVGNVTISGALPTSSEVQMGVFENGVIKANIWDGYYTTTSGYRTYQLLWHGNSAANDYYQIKMRTGDGSQFYVVGGQEDTFLCVHKIQGTVTGVSEDPKLASVYMGGTTYVSANNETETAITFNTENYDNDDFWTSGDNTKLTATTAGYFNINASAAWETIYYHGGTPFQVKIGIRKNGSTMLAQKWEWHDVDNGGARAEGLTTPISADVYLDASDYIEIMVWHSKGSTASNIIRPNEYNTFAMIHRIS